DGPGTVYLGEERSRHVVREEESTERDDDQVVEGGAPAGDEAPEVVERDPGERRGAAGLANRSGSFGVGERHDQEEQAGRQKHERREPESVQGDDAEREIDRRGDLAVGDREERGSVENPL